MRSTMYVLGSLVLLGSVLTAPGLAQTTGTVRGRVVSGEGTAVVGAQISVGTTGLGTVTNAQGNYLLLSVPAGTHTLRVQRLGFREAAAEVTVTAGSTTVHDFRMLQEAISLEVLQVQVGSRAAHTAANELAVPVDVFPRVELQATAQVEMAGVLAEMAPSVNFPRQQVSDITSGVRPFQLRGLSPDHSLVLINGKRRHPTSVVHVFGGAALSSGSSGVDINAIAPGAIGQMEILRDGAAAQYGSDAIAGVINMVLRDDVHAPELQVAMGEYFPGGEEYSRDGTRLDVSGSWGVALGARGSLNLTAAYSDRNKTDRACPDPRDQYVAGDADVVQNCRVVEKRNQMKQPNHLWGDGEARNNVLFFNAKYALGEEEETDAPRLYAFGGVSDREDKHSGFFRRPLDARNWPTIHPDGFLPSFRSTTRDFSLATGVQGRASEWNYDLGVQWGRNRNDNDIYNTHNVSLGPCLDTPCAPGLDGVLGTADDPGIPNKTEFYAGSLELNQIVASLDVVRPLEIGLPRPLNVALGASFRSDNYKVIAGETGSWINGYHPNRNGGVAAVGSQVFAGFRPDDEADATRNNIGVYADLETELSDRLLVATAARFENYSDFGSTLTGKVAARFKAAEQFILRAAVSTGFRAPALAQTYYAHTSTGFRTVDGQSVAYEIRELPINSPEARALGAVPLKEERSRNISAGLALTPTTGLNITADVYHIDVDDRIILTGSLTGPTVRALLAGYSAEDVKFFTNSIDSRTYGVDLTTRYRYLFSETRLVELLFSYGFNKNKIRDVHVPPVIDEIRDQVVSPAGRVAMEEGRPRDRFTTKGRMTLGNLHFGLGANYYGKVVALYTRQVGGVNEDYNHAFSAKTVVDADIGYNFGNRFELVLGAENLLDTYPDPTPEGQNNSGIFRYPGSSGFGYNGRYLYTTMRVRM